MSRARRGIYRDIDQEAMRFFDLVCLNEIEHMAAGLEPEEVLVYYGVSQSELEASEEDAKAFTLAYNKGRVEAKRKAVDCLFSSMKTERGKEASICYLKHFGSDQWKQAEEKDGSERNFKFTVTMPPNTDL